MPTPANDRYLTKVRDHLGALYAIGLLDDATFAAFLTKIGVETSRVTVTTWRLGTRAMPAGALLFLDDYLASPQRIIDATNVRLGDYGVRCVPDGDVAPSGRELVEEVMDLPTVVATIHERVREARRDGVVTPEEATSIDQACEAAVQEIAEVRACVRPALRAVGGAR